MKKNYLLITLFTLFSGYFTIVNAQWQKVSDGKGDYSSLNDLDFPTALDGYIVGGNGTMKKTSDGGQTWSSLNTGVDYSLKGVSFPSLETGYVVGDAVVIRKTTDGGKTWVDRAGELGCNAFHCIYFINQDTGFVGASSERIFKTTNGGSSWNLVNTGATTNPIKRIRFFNDTYGMASSSNGILLRTTDGGSTWNYLTNVGPSGANYEDLNIPDSGNGYLCEGKHIYKSTDLGNTWNLQATISTIFIRMSFISGSVGYGTNSNGDVFATINNGTTWIPKGTASLYNAISGVLFTSSANGLLIGKYGEIRLTNNACSSWQTIAGGGDRYNSVFFTSPTRGFVAGELGMLRKTTDGGQTWTDFVTGTLQHLTDIHFPDAKHGYACGRYALLITSDSGNTWQLKNHAMIWDKIYFTDSTKGYASDYYGGIYKTTNGGLNWSQVNTGYTDLNEIFFPTKTTGFISGKGKILKTTDGGVSWTKVYDLINEPYLYIGNLQFTDSLNGYGYYGDLLKTTDGGITWNSYPSPYGSNNFYFSSTDTGYGCGSFINETYDGGYNWFSQPSLTHSSMYEIHFPDKYTGYAVGENRTVLQYLGISTKTSKPIENQNSISVFPNPSTDYISINNPEGKKLNVSIYNASGMKVYENIISDKYINTSSLPEGIYFIRIISNGHVSYVKNVISR